MELDEVADELYEVPPEQFVAVRTTRQDAAKAAGDKALAKVIGALPKPSTAAWVCNLLVREHRAEIEGLVQLGDLLRDAQQNLAGNELKALNRQRSQLLTALTRQASALARQRGHAVSTAVAGQVEETLRAGMTDPEAGAVLLSGRLTSAMSYSGMGTAVRADLRLVRPPEPGPEPARPARRRGEPVAERRREEEERRRREAEERRLRELAEARRAAAEATAVAEEAVAAAEQARRAADRLDARRAELRARIDELATELARVEEEAGVVADDLARAQRRRRTAERAAGQAVEIRDRASAHADALAGTD